MGANSTSPIINININIEQIKNRLLSPRLRLKEKGEIFEMKKDKIAIDPFRSSGLKIYETKSYQKIQVIKIDKEIVEKILELDNNDLILACKTKSDYKGSYIIKIYRLKNGSYELLQIIDNDNDGYEKKIKNSCNFIIRYKVINYKINDLIKLTQNKFISISDLGFKIYSLSNKDETNSEYTLCFNYKNESHDRINYIYPINENELIIIYFITNYTFFGNNYFDIEKYDIKNNKMIKNIYHKKNYKYGNSILLKKKYLIIIISGKIIIFDVIKGEKKLVSSSPGNNDKYASIGKLYNWESIYDNIFLLVKDEQFFFIQYDDSRNNVNIIGSFQLDIKNKNIQADKFYYDKKIQIRKFNDKNEFYSYEDEFINFY